MSELARRVTFAVIAAPIAAWIVFAGGAALAGLLAVAAALAAWEFFRLADLDGLRPMRELGIVLAGVLPLAIHAQYLGLVQAPAGAPVLLAVAVLAVAIWIRPPQTAPLGAAASTLLGILYTGGLLSFGYAIRYHPYAVGRVSLHLLGGTYTVGAGGFLLLLPVLLTWATDIGAFFVGRAFGKRRLLAAVSPGKTVAGAWGGIVCSVIVGWAYVHAVLRPATALAFTPWGLVVFAVAVSAAAQCGDLFESLLKREAGVKDSSQLIPGHGGVLDRLDSLLFALPVAHLLFGGLLVWAPT